MAEPDQCHFGTLDRDRNLGTGAWGQEFGDRSLGTGVWGAYKSCTTTREQHDQLDCDVDVPGGRATLPATREFEVNDLFINLEVAFSRKTDLLRCIKNPRARSQARTISGAQRGPSYRATSYAFRGVQIERLSRRRFSGDGADRGLDDKDSSKFKCGEIRKASGGLLVQRPTRTQCCIFRSAALRGML